MYEVTVTESFDNLVGVPTGYIVEVILDDGRRHFLEKYYSEEEALDFADRIGELLKQVWRRGL